MGISKVTRNFQVTLPKDVRSIMSIGVGDSVLFAVEGKKVDLVKVDRSIARETAGLWSGMKETGVEFQKRLRLEWRKRQRYS
ncbi:AbrB/MazE/SpoVT family DNA-binding domain-containing protein [Candidatus Woesearchaeota archaeon]|nr:AbrB/MazE/SpoVT family DNA-binding domain-containing protein [Candidatus Woesearchaeota archaeon]